MLVISICIVSLTFYSDLTKEHTRIALISFKSIWYDGKVKKKKQKKNSRFVSIPSQKLAYNFLFCQVLIVSSFPTRIT